MPSFYAVSGPNLAWQTSKNVDRMIWTPPTDEREDRSIAAIRLEIYENLEIYEKMRKELDCAGYSRLAFASASCGLITMRLSRSAPPIDGRWSDQQRR